MTGAPRRRRHGRRGVTRAARGVAGRAASASSSLSWTPPKPPLLMHSTWSPGRAAATMRATSSSIVGGDDRACAPSGASACGGVPAEAAAVAEREVGLLERPRQLRLHRAELHRVRARLEHGEDARRADLAAQAVDGGAHRRRVVREVVVDRDRRRRSPRSSSRRLTFWKLAERRAPRPRGDADVLGGGDRGERVELVVLAEQRPLDARDLQAAAQHVEGVRLAARAQRAGRFLARAEALHLAPAAPREHALQRSRRAR